MGYRVHNYHKSTEQKAIEGFLKGLWWLISLPFRLLFGKKLARRSPQGEGRESLDAGYVRQKWAEIEELMRLGSPSNYARAVLEADKLLDHVLKGLRTPGLTMGDRLKASKNRFSKEGIDAAWHAHKIRNELVHNSEFQVMDYTAKEAIKNFHKALKELIN